MIELEKRISNVMKYYYKKGVNKVYLKIVYLKFGRLK